MLIFPMLLCIFCIPSFMKCLFKSFVQFLHRWLACFLIFEFQQFSYILALYQICNFQIFYHYICISFHVLNHVYWKAVFSFNEVKFVNLFLYGLCFCVICKKIFLIEVNISSIFSPKSIRILGLYLDIKLVFK